MRLAAASRRRRNQHERHQAERAINDTTVVAASSIASPRPNRECGMTSPPTLLGRKVIEKRRDEVGRGVLFFSYVLRGEEQAAIARCSRSEHSLNAEGGDQPGSDALRRWSINAPYRSSRKETR